MLLKKSKTKFCIISIKLWWFAFLLIQGCDNSNVEENIENITHICNLEAVRNNRPENLIERVIYKKEYLIIFIDSNSHISISKSLIDNHLGKTICMFTKENPKGKIVILFERNEANSKSYKDLINTIGTCRTGQNDLIDLIVMPNILTRNIDYNLIIDDY